MSEKANRVIRPQHFVFGSGKQMDTLTQLQQNRAIIHDLTLSPWQESPAPFSRLAFWLPCATFPPNVYEHAALARIPERGGSASLEHAIQELSSVFWRPLWRFAEEDFARAPPTLRMVTQGAARGAGSKPSRILLPAESPEYLKELFCSNAACNSGDSRERAFTEQAAG